MTGFEGFPPQALELYTALAADNTREFWAEHKTVYEQAVRDPMRALVDELADEFGPAKVFRPHRDLRFSADKTPYKTSQGAFVGGRAGLGYYVRLDGHGLVAGGGFRSHGTDDVRRLRVAVADESTGPQLVSIVAELRASDFAVEGEEVKTRPRDYPADHPRADLLRCRSLMAVKDFGAPDWLARRAALDEVRSAWRRVTPLRDWVLANVAGADQPGATPSAGL